MPQMANITVKKADNTTDITYIGISPSAGDTIPAIWRADAVTTVPKHRPTLSLRFKDNGPKTARVAEWAYKMPIFALVNGVETQLAIVPFEGRCTLPTNVDANAVKEAIFQHGNLLVNALIRSCFTDGYSAT